MHKRIGSFVIMLSCSVALATGGDNTHGQGVRYAGAGFDEQNPLQRPQWVPWFKIQWPLKPLGIYKSEGGGDAVIIEANCPPQKHDQLFAKCFGKVKNAQGAHKPVCGHDDPVPLLAIRGRLDVNSGDFIRDDPAVTFACAPQFKPAGEFMTRVEPIKGVRKDEPAKGLKKDSMTDLDTSEDLGVLAKCYFWGFAESRDRDQGDQQRFLTYQACIRAARAEYCGEGISQTIPNTLIQIYLPGGFQGDKKRVWIEGDDCPVLRTKIQAQKGIDVEPCFEALWNEKRAVCVSHARFEEMPANCQSQFGNKFKSPSTVVHDGGTSHGSPHLSHSAPPSSDGGVVSGPLASAPVAIVGGSFPVLIPANPGDLVVAHCTPTNYQEIVVKSRIQNRSAINMLDGGVKGCMSDIPCP